MTQFQIAGKWFRVTDEGLNRLNDLLFGSEFTPLKQKYNNRLEMYEYEVAPKVRLETEIRVKWTDGEQPD